MAAGETDEDGRSSSVSPAAINIIADGSWSMRSHQYHYSAKSVLEVIIAEQTKKLLGVLNKFCSISGIAVNLKMLLQFHKNWEGIFCHEKKILQFKAQGIAKDPQPTLGSRFIGDGNRGVHKSIVQNSPPLESIKLMSC